MQLKKIESCVYQIVGTEFVVEQMERGWDAYIPHPEDRMLRLWESPRWKTRREAVASAQMQIRINRRNHRG